MFAQPGCRPCLRLSALTHTALKYFHINHEDQRFFQFDIIMNVLSNSFRFILILMLWVHGHYKHFTVSMLQILVSVMS